MSTTKRFGNRSSRMATDNNTTYFRYSLVSRAFDQIVISNYVFTTCKASAGCLRFLNNYSVFIKKYLTILRRKILTVEFNCLWNNTKAFLLSEEETLTETLIIFVLLTTERFRIARAGQCIFDLLETRSSSSRSILRFFRRRSTIETV